MLGTTVKRENQHLSGEKRRTAGKMYRYLVQLLACLVLTAAMAVPAGANNVTTTFKRKINSAATGKTSLESVQTDEKVLVENASVSNNEYTYYQCEFTIPGGYTDGTSGIKLSGSSFYGSEFTSNDSATLINSGSTKDHFIILMGLSQRLCKPPN